VVSEFDGFIDGFAGTVNASAPVKMSIVSKIYG
jgi:hypothetical protein